MGVLVLGRIEVVCVCIFSFVVELELVVYGSSCDKIVRIRVGYDLFVFILFFLKNEYLFFSSGLFN